MFALAQRILGALPFVDVRQQHAPPNHPPAWIAQRKSVVLEPTIGAVRPPESLHDLVWAARGDRLCKGLGDVWKVLRVNGVVRPPVFQLFKGPSGVFDDSAVDEFDLAGSGQHCDQAGNAVHQ